MRYAGIILGRVYLIPNDQGMPNHTAQGRGAHGAWKDCHGPGGLL